MIEVKKLGGPLVRVTQNDPAEIGFVLDAGPNDLTIDYGGAPTYIATDPRVVGAMDHSITLAKKHGITAGTYAGSVEVARTAIEKGFHLISLGYAAKLMFRTAADVLEQVFPGRASSRR